MNSAVTGNASPKSGDSAASVNNCPICNKLYERHDTTYPLQCQTKQCRFNMCTECTQNLLQSTSSQEIQTASDGNRYTLDLKCPSCRGLFGVSLNDILFLRENDYEEMLTLKDKKDYELSATELRKKYDVNRLNLIESISKIYEDFCNYGGDTCRTVHENNEHNGNVSSHDSNSYNDIVLLSTTKRSDDDEHDIAMIQYKEKKMEYVSSMLFYGLADSMTTAERIYVKELMTSGSTMKIVQATYILASIVDMNRNRGGTPSMRMLRETQNNNHHHFDHGDGDEPDHLRKIQSEGTNNYNPKYKSYEEKINTKRVKSTKAMAATICMPLSVHNQTELQLNNHNRERWKKLYPIPNRMPRSITLRLNFDLNSRWSCPLTFVDDEESFMNLRQSLFNGNNATKDVRKNLVRDAFQELKVNFGRTKIVKKEPLNQTVVENILAVINDDDFHDESPSINIPWRRVVVASADGEVLRSGIRSGDVITHLDGEAFDGNAEKLRIILSRKQKEWVYDASEDSVPSCQIVVNAEVGVAEALRIRNVVAENQSD